MNIRRVKPSGTVLVAVLALVIGLEAPAMAHQVKTVAHKISGSRLKSNTVTGKQIKESTLAIVPKAKTATTAQHIPPPTKHLLTLIDGWRNDADFKHDAAYTVDAQGYVHLEGAISSIGTDDTPFVLPIGARPAIDTNEPALQNNDYVGAISIPADGEVEIIDDPGVSAGNDFAFTSLDGITFSTR